MKDWSARASRYYALRSASGRGGEESADFGVARTPPALHGEAADVRASAVRW